MYLEIEHRLSFAYDAYIRESFLELRMQPKTTPHQALSSFVLAVGPPTKVSRYRDWNDNTVHHFTIVNFHDRIEVSARSLVSTAGEGPGLGAADARSATDVPYPLLDFLDFGGPVRNSPALRKFAQAVSVPAGVTLGEVVGAYGRHIRSHFAYRKNVTRYDSTTDDFLQIEAGVCQDFTHLMLGLLRLRQIPCRYVSGYLHVEQEDDGDVAQSHAWIEFYAPGAGWIPFDPTHNREIDERYVVVGHGRHYDDVPPNKGIYRGNADEALEAQVVTRPSMPKGISALYEEMEQIDVPVYPEIPERRRDRGVLLIEDPTEQQQQQQQRWAP